MVRPFDYLVLGTGVLAVSTAALLIRAAEAPALVIASYRLVLASLPLLAVTGVVRRRFALATRERTLLALLAGVFLALHFAFWIASVQQTTIATSVVLVTAQPLLVAALSGPLFGERPSGATWLGIAIAGLGALVMIGDDIGSGAGTLAGDFFAVLGAVFAAAYFLCGRSLRLGGESWLAYVTLAYSTAAIVLVALAVAAGEPFGGYGERTYACFVALAVVPQLIGHTALNRSLGYLPAVSVTIAVLGEPVGATLLGIVFLEEVPSLLETAGGLLVLGGVYAGLRGGGRSQRLVKDEAAGAAEG